MKLAFIKAISLLVITLGKESCATRSTASRPSMVTCGPNQPCPRGTTCLKIYGKEGLCVLTK